MKSRVIVSALIENKDKVLFGRKKKGIGPYPDTWHLIGGGVDLGEEKLEEALIREIKEEAQIDVEIVEKIGFDEDMTADKHGNPVHYVFLVYRVKYKSGEPTPNDDIVELKWFNKDHIDEISLNAPSKRLFRSLGYL